MSALLITDMPVITVSDVRGDLREAVEWLCRPPCSREQRVQRDALIVRLRQDDWHLTQALRDSRP